METEWNKKAVAEGDTSIEQAEAIADVEVSLECALRAGISPREIRKIVRKILEYNL